MRLFIVRGDPAFSMLRPVQESAWDARGGIPVAGPWEATEFTHLDDAPFDFVAADCLTMNTGADGFLVSAFARDLLSPLLKEAGQFVPVRVFGLPYWWLNCLASIQALDRERTDADWSTIDGAWGSFSWVTTTRRLSFRHRQLEEAPLLFRIPEYPQGALFARDEFQAFVETHELIGFKFDLVWSTAEGGIIDPPGVGLGEVLQPISLLELEDRRRLAQQRLADRRQV